MREYEKLADDIGFQEILRKGQAELFLMNLAGRAPSVWPLEVWQMLAVKFFRQLVALLLPSCTGRG